MDEAEIALRVQLLGVVRSALGEQIFKAEREERLDEAERLYRQWIGYLPDDPAPKYGLALLLLSQGRYEEGFKLYEARLDLAGAGIVKPIYCPPS